MSTKTWKIPWKYLFFLPSAKKVVPTVYTMPPAKTKIISCHECEQYLYNGYIKTRHIHPKTMYNTI